VLAIGSPAQYAARILRAGFEHISVPFSGDGVNPLRELKTVLLLMRILRETASELVLSYTPKGNLYSGLASMGIGINTIPNISGLGRAFISRFPVPHIVRFLYRVVLRRSSMIFFQNEDDRRLFIQEGLVKQEKTQRVPGSGVDLDRFKLSSNGSRFERKVIRFLLAGRLLWDKGVGEFVQAARLLKSKYPKKVEFQLLGFLDVQNPSVISRTDIGKWESEGVIIYLGVTDDIQLYYETADCVVLPSYREGVPRTLLEAAAMELPIITTDAVGCRDAVEDGKTGFICKTRDAVDLARKMEKMIHLAPEEREAMGKAGRVKMEREFDERIVIDQYLSAIEQVSITDPLCPCYSRLQNR
jgi:glycosyltransferase involved in cell wall biosynthesis